MRPNVNSAAPLTVEQHRALRDAFLDAFRNKRELVPVVAYALEINIQDLADYESAAYSTLVFHVISLAKTREQVVRLIRVALEENKSNRKLQDEGNRILGELGSQQWSGARVEGRTYYRGNEEDAPDFLKPSLHYFDLNNVAEECLNVLPDGPGVFGFTLATGSTNLLRHFSYRLKSDLPDAARVVVRPPITIDPRFTTVERELRTISTFAANLQQGDVIASALVYDAVTARELWKQLDKKLRGQTTNRFIMVIGGPLESAEVEGMVPLPVPVFAKAHVQAWVTPFVRERSWPPEAITRWTQTTVTVCRRSDSDPTLTVDAVYGHLEELAELLRKHADLTLAEFYQKLDTLEGYI